jgi:hypothetical protein
VTTIAFDGICLGDGAITGVARSFLNALTAYAVRDHAACILLVPEGATIEPIARVRLVTAPRGALQRQRQLPRLLLSLHADLLHSSVASVPLRAPCPTIATAHDLPWLHPELDEPFGTWRPLVTRCALRSANRILAPSTMTKLDVEHLLGKRCPRVELVMHGTTIGPAPTAASTDARNGPLLVLGDDRARKNRKLLIQAHQLAKARCEDLPALTFIGPPDHYVDESQKNELLQSCRALVHVSRFEGFGMPVLEGLANGAPVVCSDLPPHREIAGDDAIFVDPDRMQSVATALMRIHTEADLRHRLASSGHQRAQQFSADHTAARWHQVHQQILQERSA